MVYICVVEKVFEGGISSYVSMYIRVCMYVCVCMLTYVDM